MKKLMLLLILVLIPLKVYGISASSYIVMDTDNNRVLEGNNIHKQSLIASITKIMTSMVVINNSTLDETITIGDEVLKSYGSGIYISVGEKLTIRDLLYGLMLRSGNDAAISLAYKVGGSMEGFSLMMNDLASSLNMKNTNFVNSHGLEDGDNANKSTVYDMALLSSYAIKNEDYQKIVSTKDITIKSDIKTYVWHNKNKLLSSYKYCTGGKTGFTQKARRTLVTNASKNNVNLTVVTFNDGNDFQDHQDLYEKYFNSLKKYQILTKGEFQTDYDNTYLEEDYSMSLTKEEYQNLQVIINYYQENATNIVGNVEVKLNGVSYFTEDIIQKQPVTEEKISFFDKIKRKILELW